MIDSSPDTQRLGKRMVIIAWLLVLGLLALFFQRYLGHQRNPNQQVVSSLQADAREVVLQRNRYGHYVATARINGMPAEVMVDTGASLVAVPQALAEQLHLPYGFRMTVMTANGEATGYSTQIARLELGNISLADVRATVLPDMDQVLLGMNLLQQLEFTQRGDTLTLRQYTQ